MLINEIFTSIQGESRFAGCLTVFVRLSGCNLACDFCDTAYAGNSGNEMDVRDIFAKIRKKRINNVCITGGEPMMQEKEACELMKMLAIEKFTVLLFTNGSLPLENVPSEVIKIIDIKIPEKGSETSFINDNFNYLYPHDEIKFVVRNRKDFYWACNFALKHEIFAKVAAASISPSHGVVSPRRIAEWIKEKKLPFRLNLQIHKYINVE
jgi:7-carboxy-7-deazaguanine synthase